MAQTRDQAYSEWESTFRSKAGRDPNADDLNDFNNKWAKVESGERDWSGLAAETATDLNTRFNRPTASNGGVGGDAAQSVTASWSSQPAPATPAVDPAVAAENKARNDALYAQLLQRSQQSLAIDRNDPIIRGQADAYSANEERSRRNYLADTAERSGPLANLRGEERLASERVGQRTGSFEAELMGRELTARREEIAQALTGMQGLLTTDQQQALQRELAQIDAAIRQQQLSITSKGMDQDWQKALLQNEQFMSSLGLQAEDRSSYWDALRRGLI